MSVRLTRRPLSVSAAVAELDRTGLGGVVVFVGRVRPDRSARGRVVALEYEADLAMARRQLAVLERSARRRFAAERAVVWHRLGTLGVGEISVIIGAAGAHRAPAFDATRYLIEELKRSVPIWKTDRVRPGRRRRRRPSPRRERSSG